MHYSPQQELVFWSHLWFLPRLLLISGLSLPLLPTFRSGRGRRLIARYAVLRERRRGALFLLALPLGLVEALLGWQWQILLNGAATDGFNELALFVFYRLVFV
jgi:hypothetical protein